MIALNVSRATTGKILVESKFSGYDTCINPYVGCEFGCSYCYVRQFVKDDKYEWGQFVRTRDHLYTKLASEITKIQDKTRLVIGTMTDPYQPQEKKRRLTRRSLILITEQVNKFSKVGIFTRSPMIIDDLPLIRNLPKCRVHYTVTPYQRDTIKRIEPIPVTMEARFRTMRKLHDGGVRIQANIAPAIPVLSDGLTAHIASELASIGVAEFFVDPMQAYSASFTALQASIGDTKEWPEVYRIMSNKSEYIKWKSWYKDQWFEAWKKVGSEYTLPIWSDHVNQTWIDMRTGLDMSKRAYGDDVVQ